MKANTETVSLRHSRWFLILILWVCSALSTFPHPPPKKNNSPSFVDLWCNEDRRLMSRWLRRRWKMNNIHFHAHQTINPWLKYLLQVHIYEMEHHPVRSHKYEAEETHGGRHRKTSSSRGRVRLNTNTGRRRNNQHVENDEYNYNREPIQVLKNDA